MVGWRIRADNSASKSVCTKPQEELEEIWRNLKRFEEIVLDKKVTLSNHPFMYVEEGILILVLSPNTFLYGKPLPLPEEDIDEENVPEIRRQERCIDKCKKVARTRWKKEYLKALRERHNMLHQAKDPLELHCQKQSSSSNTNA